MLALAYLRFHELVCAGACVAHYRQDGYSGVADRTVTCDPDGLAPGRAFRDSGEAENDSKLTRGMGVGRRLLRCGARCPKFGRYELLVCVKR